MRAHTVSIRFEGVPLHSAKPYLRTIHQDGVHFCQSGEGPIESRSPELQRSSDANAGGGMFGELIRLSACKIQNSSASSIPEMSRKNTSTPKCKHPSSNSEQRADCHLGSFEQPASPSPICYKYNRWVSSRVIFDKSAYVIVMAIAKF